MPKLFEVRVPQTVSYTEWTIYEIEAESEDEAIQKVKNDNHGSYPRYEEDSDYLYENSEDHSIEVEEISTTPKWLGGFEIEEDK